MTELRDYQVKALAALWDYWKAGGGNPLIDLATGTGKSYLIAELCQRFSQQGRRTLILSHVREIIEQDCKAILSLWPQAPVGINSAALGERNVDAPIVLATVQSVFRNPQALGARDLIIIDEAHLVPHGDDGMFRSTIAGLRALSPLRVAGFTATPFRLDCGRLDEGEGRIFDTVVFRYGIAEAIAGGWLSPLVAKGTKSEIDVTDVARRGGEFISGELEAAADQNDIVEGAVAEIIDQGVGRRNAWHCFCCGVDHAYHVRDAMRRHGITAETVTGDTPADERKQIIDDFRAGRILSLAGCNVFTTGFDVATIDLIAMLRPTLSTGLYIQMLGRGTRKSPGKSNCLVLDFAGNVLRHGPVDDACAMVAGNGSEKTESGPRAKRCPECSSLVPPATRTCPDCGFEWPSPKPAHAAVASTLAPLSGAQTWIDVVNVKFREHIKPGKPPSMRIDFWTGELTVSDWLAFEHSNGARWHAARKWRDLGGGVPVPKTTEEALARSNELNPVAAIAIQHDGEYWRVVNHRVAS
jgi:DNA repair protein RadD